MITFTMYYSRHKEKFIIIDCDVLHLNNHIVLFIYHV